MKKSGIIKERFELIIAIFLGVAALLTAWASWIASLHGGNQSTNYTESTNLSADGNSLWNEASQNLALDMQIWTELNSLNIDYEYATAKGDTTEAEKINWKINEILNNRVSDSFEEAIKWAFDQKEYATPFEKEGYVDSYYTEANETLVKSKEVLEQGKKDNANGDKLGLVTVFYSVVLFLVGIVSTFNNQKTKLIVLGIALVCFILATIIMFTVPLPTGFSLLSFFK